MTGTRAEALLLEVELHLDRDVLTDPACIVPTFPDVEVEAVDHHRAGERRAVEREVHHRGPRLALQRQLAVRPVAAVRAGLDRGRLEARLGILASVEPVR